jgi:hypothetical protein
MVNVAPASSKNDPFITNLRSETTWVGELDRLREHIQWAHAQSCRTYGSPRIYGVRFGTPNAISYG